MYTKYIIFYFYTISIHIRILIYKCFASRSRLFIKRLTNQYENYLIWLKQNDNEKRSHLGVPFLNKKQQAAPPKKPLPTLARGVLHKETLAPKESVPDRLPTIMPRPKESFGDARAFGDAPKKDTFGDEKPAMPTFSEHKYDSVFDQPEPKRSTPNELDASFFSDLAKHLNTEEELIRRKLADPQGMLSRNLVAEMKEYWEAQKANTTSVKQNKELESDVMAQVDELRRLESDWQRLEQEIEDAKKQMMEKELQIEDESKKLKLLMKRWALKKDAPKENWFILKDGQAARNIPELAFHLRKMDTNQFYAHVTLGRNDFATWIRDVFHDDELASSLEQEHDKNKIVEMLDKSTR